MTVEQYQAWRKTIPFSDAEIARGLLAHLATLTAGLHQPSHLEYVRVKTKRLIASVLRGHVSGPAVRYALPHLVVSCGVCGKPALYRHFAYGLCRAHKTFVPAPERVRRTALHTKQAAMEGVDREFDRHIARYGRKRPDAGEWAHRRLLSRPIVSR